MIIQKEATPENRITPSQNNFPAPSPQPEIRHMIEIAGLVKRYHKKTAVNHLSFQVKDNEAFALLGSNGAGKSTTIKMMLGLVKPDGGTVHIRNGKTVGYSPETPYFPEFLTGTEVLKFYARLQNIPKMEREETACKILALVGLEADRTKVRNYSKGMLQRLALGQALIGNPDILVLDEPCAGLDAMGRIEMIQLIRRLKDSGKTILMNSHILSDIEKVCDCGIIMKNGNCLREWSKEELTGKESLEEIFTRTIGGEA